MIKLVVVVTPPLRGGGALPLHMMNAYPQLIIVTGCFQMLVKILANRTQVPGVARRSVPCAASSPQPRALASLARRDTSYPSLDSQPPPLLGPGLPTSYSYYFAFYKSK